MCLVVPTAPTGTHPWYHTVNSWIQQKPYTVEYVWCPVLPEDHHPELLQSCHGLPLLELYLPILSHRGSKSHSCNGNRCAQSPRGLLSLDPAVDSHPLE